MSVVLSSKYPDNRIVRRRQCMACRQRFSTVEVIGATFVAAPVPDITDQHIEIAIEDFKAVMAAFGKVVTYLEDLAKQLRTPPEEEDKSHDPN